MPQPQVLLVDNDPLDIELTCEVLEDLGLRVTAVTGGQEALSFLQHTERAPDLVLLDVSMPGLNGFDVLTRITACPRRRAVPVVLFSTSDDPGDVRRGLGVGPPSIWSSRCGSTPSKGGCVTS